MLMRWDPFNEVTALQRDINRLFDRAPRRQSGFGETRYPLMDISETDGEIRVRALLPGMQQQDVNITLHQNVLSISGEKKAARGSEEGRMLRHERNSGHFQRTITLSKPVEMNKIQAKLADGVLTLTLPLEEEARPKQIEVAVN